MNDTVILDATAMERMLYAIESSLKVSRRFQFFLWAQGALQGVLPHAILLCVFGDFSASRFRYDVFARNEVDQVFVDQFTDPVDGPLHKIIRNWLGDRRLPRLYTEAGVCSEDGELQADLDRLGCGHVMAHGAREINGDEGSFFVLLQMVEVPNANHAYALDLIMPHLHMALYRQFPNEPGQGLSGGEISQENVLSVRELEVLRWVREGKTNQQIGLELGISALTVKNHVQKILRKLRVHNRAQAVAKGQTSRLFPMSPAAHGQGLPD